MLNTKELEDKFEVLSKKIFRMSNNILTDDLSDDIKEVQWAMEEFGLEFENLLLDINELKEKK